VTLEPLPNADVEFGHIYALRPRHQRSRWPIQIIVPSSKGSGDRYVFARFVMRSWKCYTNIYCRTTCRSYSCFLGQHQRTPLNLVFGLLCYQELSNYNLYYIFILFYFFKKHRWTAMHSRSTVQRLRSSGRNASVYDHMVVHGALVVGLRSGDRNASVYDHRVAHGALW